MCSPLRSGRSCRGVRWVMSVPPSTIRPEVGSTRRTTQLATVVLPLPDSHSPPTSPSTSPRVTLNETPSTACTTPLLESSCPRPSKRLTRSTTSSAGRPSGRSCDSRVEAGDPVAGATSRSLGAVEHLPRSTRSQRSAKEQPSGTEASDGTDPGISRRRSESPAPGPGRAPRSPIVYGCEDGRRARRRARPRPFVPRTSRGCGRRALRRPRGYA